MNATTAPTTPRASPPAWRLTGPRVLASEWIKMWSMRSSWLTDGLALLYLILFGLMDAELYAPRTARGVGPDPVQVALDGIVPVLLIVGALGVVVMSGEYATGSIRSTMTAVPRRLPVLWAKAAVAGAVALILGAVGSVVSYAGGEAFLHGTRIALPLTAPGVLRSLMLAAAAIALISIVGTALGTLLRSTAAAIVTLTVLLLVLQVLATLLPTRLENDISPYVLGNAVGAMYSLHHAAGTLTPWGGFVVVVAWTAAALAAAAYRLLRSDV